MQKTLHNQLLFLFLFVNLLAVFWRFRPLLPSLTSSRSYIGHDYPVSFPIGKLDDVAFTLHESTRLALNASDPVAEAEWLSMLSLAKGAGRTRLGEEHRVFEVTLFHQMHCLRRIESALLNRNDPHSSLSHIHHCFNYLRQTVLCESADMLEDGDFMERDYERDRVGASVVCQDWTTVFDALDQKFDAWVAWTEKSWN